MGMPSLLEDTLRAFEEGFEIIRAFEDRFNNLDRFITLPSKSELSVAILKSPKKIDTKALRSESEAIRLQNWTAAYVKDQIFWMDEVSDVVPLRRSR